MCNNHKKISVNSFFDIKHAIDILSKKKKDLFNTFSELQILQEERLELQLNILFDKLEKDVIEKFDKIFPLNKNFNLLKSSELDDVIKIVSVIQPNPFYEILLENLLSSYLVGGKAAFSVFEIRTPFNLRDLNAEKKLKTEMNKLSKQVSKELQNKIKNELLDGVKNGDSIPQLRQRVSDVWNNPITVTVPPKVIDGEVVRQGYSYEMSNKHWATTVSRTETTKAYNMGRLDGFRQGGVVSMVEFSTSPDERLCTVCAGLEGVQYSLDKADGIVPVHANCRCTLIPLLGDFDYSKAQAIFQQNINLLYEID